MSVAAKEISRIVTRNKQLDVVRGPWLDIWSLIGRFVDTRVLDFTSLREQGPFVNREIFDTTAPRAATTAASSILSALWPQSVKRLRFVPPRSLPETSAIKAYYEEITRRQMEVMDNPDAGLQLALDEYMLEEMKNGTAGVETMRDKKTKVKYRTWGVRNMKVAEGSDGRVNTIYIEWQQTVRQVVDTYGHDKVTEKTRGLYNEGKLEDWVTVLIAIEPRVEIKAGAKGKDRMPFQSVHMELEAKHVLRDGGFNELPINVARMMKVLGEAYGRSSGMAAISDTLEINTVMEAVTIAIEKMLDPPLGILDDGKLGGSDVDTSAGALNVFNISGRAGEKNPVFPLFTVGEVKQTVQLVEMLKQSISDAFFLDRLLDFNNETRMTLGEANLRNKLRNSTLGGIYTRQIMECISPTVIRTFNILLEDGTFGYPAGSQELIDNPGALVIPEEVAKLMASGQNVYEIEYFTPAMRIMQAEEAEGIMRAWEMAGVIATAVPQVVDNLDEDKSIQAFARIVGSPSEILRAQSAVDTIRKAREAAAQKQQEMVAAQQGSEALRNVGQSGLLQQATASQQAGQKK